MPTPTTYSNQSVTVTSTASGQPASLKVTASSSLMTNYEPASAVTANHQIKPVQDTNGNPIIFSVGTNQDLYVIIRDPQSSSGWAQYDVTTSIAPGWEVSTFDTYRFDNNTFVLAVALVKNDAIRFYVTPALSTDTSADFWKTFSTQLHERPNDQIKEISSILLGPGDENSIPTILALASTDGTNFDRYTINADTSNTESLWTLLPLPSNAHRGDGSNPILATALGKCSNAYGLAGTYTLYYVGDDVQLTFDSIQKVGGEIISHSMTAPDGAQALATVPGDEDGNTDLYVAGNGIFHFASDRQGHTDQAIQIAESLQASPQTELAVMADSEHVAVWFLNDGIMSHMQGSKGDSMTWTYPMPVMKDVGQIAAIRNTVLQSNEIFTVNADNELMYMYQDPSSTIWRKHPIVLPDTGKALPFQGYTTVIHFEDEKGAPVTDPVSLSASSWIYATINGENHILDTQSSVNMTPDASGGITIITKGHTPSSPILSISSSNFHEILDVNPQHVVNQNLKHFTSAGNLSSAQTQDGHPVIPPNSSISADQVAGAFGQLTQAADAAQNATISIRSSSSQPSNKVDPGKLPHASSAPPEGAIHSLFGDVFHAITHDLKEVESWVMNIAEDGLHFVVHLAEGVAHFVLDTLEKVYEALSWVLKQIEMGIEKLIQWIGQLFDWEDIKTCHTIITNAFNQLLDWAANETQEIQTPINTFFNEAAKTLTGKSLPEDLTKQTLNGAVDQYKQQNKSQSEQSEGFHKSPAGGFAKYHILHSGSGQAAPSITEAISQVIKDFLNTVKKAGQDIYATTKTVIFDIIKGINDGSMTLGDIVQKVCSDTILGTLKTIQDVVDGFLNIVGDVIQLIKAILNKAIEIPFITGFYKLMTGDDELTILNVVAFILATPAVTMMRIFSLGKSPFANGTYGLDDTSKTYSEFMALIRPGTSAPQARGIMAEVNEPGATNVAHESDQEHTAGVLYSLIGGAVFIICESTNYVITAGQAAVEGAASFLNVVKAVLQGIIVAVTFPIPIDGREVEEGFRVLKWLLMCLTLFVWVMSLLLLRNFTLAALIQAVVHMFYPFINSIIGLIISIGIAVSMTVEVEDNPGAGVPGLIGGVLLSFALFVIGLLQFNRYDPDPDSKALFQSIGLVGASVGFGGKVLMDFANLIACFVDYYDSSKMEAHPFYA